MDFSSGECLRFLEDHGMISISGLKKQMNLERKEKKLKEYHTHVIRQGKGKDNRWFTTIPDSSKKEGRRKIAKQSKEELIDWLLNYYDVLEKKSVPSLRNIFKKWLRHNQNMSDVSSGGRRLLNDWNRFFEKEEIADMLMEDITSLYLSEFCVGIVKKYHLKKKAYYNATRILKGCFEYACLPEIGLLDYNPMTHVKINKKFFAPDSKKKAETEVFIEEEKEILIQYLWDRWHSGKYQTTTTLAVILNFYLGLRVGELVCLKWSDIKGRYLHIQRMETRTHDIDYDTLTSKEAGLVIVDHTKSSAGDREIYLVEAAMDILSMVKSYNLENGWEDDDFIFLNKRSHKRTTTEAIQSYLEYACKKAGIHPKSSHKIRKTWVSGLWQAGIHIDTIRRMAGHEDEHTTLNNYTFDTSSKKSIEDALEKAAASA